MVVLFDMQEQPKGPNEMSNNIQDIINTTSADASSVQLQAEAFNNFLAMPTTKLDADQYLVSDLDGVTEGLFGSGNMNFLMMQAGQTDDAIRAGNPFDMIGGNDGIQSVSPVLSANPFAYASQGQESDALGLRSMGDLADTAGQIEGYPGNGNTSTNMGNLGASNFAVNSDSQNPFSSVHSYASASESTTTNTYTGNDGADGASGVNGTNGTNGTNGNDGNDGLSGLDGLDGLDGITDALSLGPVGIDLNLGLDNITNVTLDIISGGQVLNVLDEVVDLSPVLAPVDNLLGDITAGLGLSAILNPFQYDDSPSDQDLSVLTDLSALGLPLLSSLDNLHIPLDPVEGLLGDLDIELDLGSEILADLLGGNNDDTDVGLDLGGLGLGALPLPELGSENILLNPVEDLLGDIDLNIAPALDLFNTSAIDNGAGDTDIIIPVDVGLLGGDVLGDALAIDLTPIEQITGDIDLDLTLAANLLGNTADGLIDNFDGGTGNDTLLADLGDGAADILSPLLPAGDSSDTDIVLGLNLLANEGAIILDPVEDLAGDIDLGIMPSLDLLDASATDNGAGDTDLVVPFDIALIDSPLLSDTVAVDLDPLEQITGDIDLNVPLTTDLVADPASLADDVWDVFEVTPDIAAASTSLVESVTQNLESTVEDALGILDTVDSGGGLTGIGILNDTLDSAETGSWTESILPEAGDLFGSGLAADIANILPDPVSAASPVETIMPAPVVNDAFEGLGLGGGRNFGGLFG